MRLLDHIEKQKIKIMIVVSQSSEST